MTDENKDTTDVAPEGQEDEAESAVPVEPADAAEPVNEPEEEVGEEVGEKGEEGEEGEEEELVFVEDPAFEVDYKGDCAYEIKVTVPPANEQKQAEDMFEELKHEAEVPGFRRGRAPLRLIQRKFAKAVKKDVTTKLVTAAVRKLVKDKHLRPIGAPEVDGLDEADDRKEGDALTFTLKFEVAPKVELGMHRGIEIEKPVLKTTDENVDEVLETMRARHALYETVEGGEVDEHDQVIIDFRGTVEGKDFPGGYAEAYPYIMGTKRFFPEFEEVLLGSSPGDVRTCDVSFAEDYSAETLRGKSAHFEITVKEIKRQNLPELDAKFATQLGYENLEDMREKISAALRAEADRECTGIAESRALEKIVAESTFELPASMVDQAAEDYYEAEIKRLRSMRVPNAEIEQRDEEIRARVRQSALNSIKTLTALYQVAEAEGIEVTDEDFERETAAISARTGATMDAVAKYLEEEDQRSTLENRILRAKTLECILSNAVVTEKEVTREELAAMTEEEGL